MTITAAHCLVATLRHHQVDRVFCVPGESYLAVLDALYDCPDIHLVSCRHESGAGFMAVADAKITGRAGTVFVSRGPGASNTTIAVHTAQQDAVPLVLFVGQVQRKERGQGAFQEVDYEQTFADMAKWVVEVHDPDRLPETIARAYYMAQSGTPGPVVVSLPEDMLAASTVADAVQPLPLHVAAPSDEQVAEVAKRLAAAEQPLLIAGGCVRRQTTRQALTACVEAWDLPVAVSFKHQDVFTNDHPNFAGHLGYGIPKHVVNTLAEADLILAVGTRLTGVTNQGYRLPKAPAPEQPLIHVYPDPDQIGRVFETAIALTCDAETFLRALAAHKVAASPGRTAWRQQLHQVYVELAQWQPVDARDGVDFGHISAALAQTLRQDAVITTDAGNFSGWLHRYFPFRSTHLLLGAVSGAMGFGVPAAVAAALRSPDRQVIGLIGDGGFLMTGNELATAMQYKAKVRLLICNNRSYGTIRLHQELTYPGRVVGTDLASPDFAMLAQAFGAIGLTINAPNDTLPVVREALATKGPVVVDVHASLDHISAYTTLQKLARRRAGAH
ncbi:MAG: thiamine pyrophosphate-dependent enzyme [Acidiferrobacterales bacterium]